MGKRVGGAILIAERSPIGLRMSCKTANYYVFLRTKPSVDGGLQAKTNKKRANPWLFDK